MKKQTKKETPGEITQSQKPTQKPDLDVGFRVFKESDAPIDEHDWFFEACIKTGLPLSLKYQTYTIEGRQIWIGEDPQTHDKIAACFDRDLPDSVFLSIAANTPKKAVFFEDAVPSKEAGLKVYRFFKKISPETEISVITPTERPAATPLYWPDPFLHQVGGDHLMKMKVQPMEFFIKFGLRTEYGLALMSYLKYLHTKDPEELDKFKQYVDFIDVAASCRFQEIDEFVLQFDDVYVRDTIIFLLTEKTDEVRRRISEMRRKEEEPKGETSDEGSS